MIERVWKETKVFILLGSAMIVAAYIGGAGSETLSWMLALFVMAVLFFAWHISHADKREEGGAEDISVSEELGHEMDLLVQKIETSTTVMLGHVRDELSQMRLLVADSIETLHEGFSEINQGAVEQNKLVHEVLERLGAALESGEKFESMVSDMNEQDDLMVRCTNHLPVLARQINKGIADVVRSLQFEDIVQQLTVTSEKHLDYIEEVLDAVDIGIRKLNSQKINIPEYIIGLHELKAQIDQLEAECRAEAERSVSQHSMRRGDIELF